MIIWIHILACVIASAKGNKLCAHPDQSLSKNQAYNPAYKYSVELGGECHLEDFQQGPLIGRGHYGIVKRAKHKATGTIVALKYLEGINPAHFSNHRNEECNQHAVESPLIVKHYCTIIHDDQVIFVMDYLDGMSLRDYFKEGGKLTEAQLQYYTAQLLVSIELLHQRRIIFGSLTSSNVMLLKDGQIKLIDFGATMKLQLGEQQDPKPQFVSYKARPHRWKNFAHDYYSLGMLVFELAVANKTGRWKDPKELKKMKCTKVLDKNVCDFISRMYTDDFEGIWGPQKITRDKLKSHPWLADINFSWLYKYARGEVDPKAEPETVKPAARTQKPKVREHRQPARRANQEPQFIKYDDNEYIAYEGRPRTRPRGRRQAREPPRFAYASDEYEDYYDEDEDEVYEEYDDDGYIQHDYYGYDDDYVEDEYTYAIY